MNHPHFRDRIAAGEALARRLLAMPMAGPVVVLALPRGGVPVAAPIARAFNAPLDLVLVRKIGVPGQPEMTLAAVAEGEPPTVVIDEAVRRRVGAETSYIAAEAQRAFLEIARRRHLYLRDRPRADLKGATAVVVDDGLATGGTMRAALAAVRQRRPGGLVMAVPVAPSDTLQAMQGLVDQVVCLSEPRGFLSVGGHYVEFPQVGDEEVRRILDANAIPDPGVST